MTGEHRFELDEKSGELLLVAVVPGCECRDCARLRYQQNKERNK